jgi:plastocyanin
MVVEPRSRTSQVIAIAVIAAIALVGIILLMPRGGQPGATTTPDASASPKESASASPEASASPSAEASPSASAGGEVGELEIEASDFAFEAPAETPAGVTRVTVNNTGQEEHQAQIVRLNEGNTFEDLTAALQQPDPSAAFALFTFSGGPTGAVPGASVATTVDLQPGTHAFLCFIESPDGVPHLAKGMVAQLEVTGTSTGGSLPAGDAEVTLQDFAYVGLTTLTPGEHTVAVTNDGPQPHEATLVKLNEGTTAEQVVQFFTSSDPPSGPPPWTSAGGIAAIATGTSATMDVSVEAGEYAFICFVPDPASGRPHAALGMVGGLTVE